MSEHTPGPWRFEFNAEHRSLHLVGGKPRYDLTIMNFCRWGMDGATIRLRDTAHDGMNVMHKLHEREDWIAPQPGREHHKSWHQLVTHPDIRLIEAAPDLLQALQMAMPALEALRKQHPRHAGDDSIDVVGIARAAIAKATGEQK